jgi:hypothetical protein
MLLVAVSPRPQALRWAASKCIDGLSVFLSIVGMSLKRNPYSCQASRWAASIRIDSLSVFLRTVGMSLKRNPYFCGIGKYEHEKPVGLLSRLLQ